MSASLISYRALKESQKINQEIREIFFESSTRKDFKDELEKEAFYFKYVGFYLTHYPDLAWVACDADRVLGYVVASPETNLPELEKLQPHLKIFNSECEKFPAHLHINCHFESRGLGIGKMLVEKVILALQSHKIRGLHIMTGPASKNRSFYKKLGFEFEVELNFQGSPILFMGRQL